MTKKEILKKYQVENNLITTPGKFQGELIYAPYFYAFEGEVLQTLNDGAFVSLILIEKEDIKQFPELNETKYILAEEDDQDSFTVIPVLSEKDANYYRNLYKNLYNSEDIENE